MTVKRPNLRIIVSLIAIVALLAVACTSNDPEPTPTPNTGSVPVFFPLVFSGQFTVAGEPGPQGVPMFARLGDGRGLFNDTVRPGEYTNVAIAPESVDAVGGEITFYLGHPDGPNVQAAETYTYDRIAQPELITLDLSFPRLP